MSFLFPTIISGCAAEYFNHSGGLTDSEEEGQKKFLGYKCVLNTKAIEESMVCDRTAKMNIQSMIFIYNLWLKL